MPKPWGRATWPRRIEASSSARTTMRPVGVTTATQPPASTARSARSAGWTRRAPSRAVLPPGGGRDGGGGGAEGPLPRRPERRRRPGAGEPQRGDGGGAVGQGAPEGAVEEGGHDVGEAGMVGHRRLAPVEETGAVVAGDLGQ